MTKVVTRLSAEATPAQIKAVLDEHVIGQSQAKIALATAASEHNRRIRSGVHIDKSNVLLVGPTGCGKTELVRILGQILGVPVAMAQATSLTEAGYVGDDVETVLLPLINAATKFENARQTGHASASAADINKCAATGIVYIDEIDKLRKTSENLSLTKDVSGEGVQQSLLTILEGCIARIPPSGGRKHPSNEVIELDTTNILFIVGGAFVGLSDLIRERKRISSGIGFGAEVRDPEADAKVDFLRYMEPSDLITYGMIPEFIGRLPIRATLRQLTVDELEQILVGPKDSVLAQKRALLAPDTNLCFTSGAARSIANRALDLGTGARGLNAIADEVLAVVRFYRPAGRFVVDQAYVENSKARLAELERQTTKVHFDRPDWLVEEPVRAQKAA